MRSKNSDISPPPLEDMEIETDSLNASKIIATAHNQQAEIDRQVKF